MSPNEKLTEMGITLPAPTAPLGAYTPAVRSANLLFLSGQLPVSEGVITPNYIGKLGYNVSVIVGQAAARQAVINALAIIEHEVGLGNVQRIVRLTGYISSTPTFTDQAQVLNGASELLMEIFGQQGIHARLALGVAVLPLDTCLEIEMIVEVK